LKFLGFVVFFDLIIISAAPSENNRRWIKTRAKLREDLSSEGNIMLDASFWILSILLCSPGVESGSDPTCDVVLTVREYRSIPLDYETCERQKVKFEDIETSMPVFSGDTPSQGTAWLVAVCQGFNPEPDSIAEDRASAKSPAG
jgi:hypothetical protein